MNEAKTANRWIRRDVRPAAFVAALVSVALLIASSTALILWRGRIDTYRRADASTESVLQAIGKDLQRTFGSYDLSLRWAINALSTPGFDTASEPIRRQMLFASDLKAQALGGLLVADETGRALYESGAPVPRIANISDKPYFQTLRDHPDSGLVFSRPFQTIISNGLSIAVARRVDGPGSLFAGVVVSTIQLKTIREIIHTAAVGTNDSIALLNDSGILIAREPWADDLVGRNLSIGPLWPLLRQNQSGTFDQISIIDGTPRHYRFARIGNLPLVLLVGVAIPNIYSDWWRGALAIGGVTAATIALLLGLARALYVELSRRRRAELMARESAKQFRMIAENVSDIIVRLDLDGVRRYVSPSVRQVLGFTPEEMLAMGPWVNFVHPEDRRSVSEAIAAVRSGIEQIVVAYRAYNKAGAEIWLEANIRMLRDAVTGKPCEMIAVTRDATARYASQQELKRLAATDGLTGVANRRTFDEALNTEWRRAMRRQERVALMMLDADYFKLYNDRYGHQGGDEILRMIGKCLAGSLCRAGDLAARYGGEEFAVLLPGTDMTGAVRIAERIRSEVERAAIPHEGSPLGHVSVSIGVACAVVMTDDDPRSVIQHADFALYEAKRSGRNRVVAANPASTVSAR